jgi:hypothetical protein
MRAILRTAARTGRRYAWRILAVAVVLGLALTVAEVIADNAIDPNNDVLSVGGTVSVEAISLFGTVLLSGFLCKLVGETMRGRIGRHGAGRHGERVTIGLVLRTLPWISLILADILFGLITIVGLLLLVIPGLIFFNLFAVVGPAIDIERRWPFSGLRRSAHLVRKRFWSVALLVSLPQLALALAESNLPDPHGALHSVEVITVRGIAIAPVEAAVGLVMVALSYRLIELDAAATGAATDAG